MADSRVTGLAELNETPATGDLVYIVDVSDTTDDITGSSRKIRMANLLASKADISHTHSQADVANLTADLAARLTEAQVRALMPNTRTVAADTVLAANDDIVLADATTAIIVTVPANVTVAFPINYSIRLSRLGTGTLSVAAATGVTIRGHLANVPQYGSYVLLKTAADAWYIEGGAA